MAHRFSIRELLRELAVAEVIEYESQAEIKDVLMSFPSPFRPLPDGIDTEVVVGLGDPLSEDDRPAIRFHVQDLMGALSGHGLTATLDETFIKVYAGFIGVPASSVPLLRPLTVLED